MNSGTRTFQIELKHETVDKILAMAVILNYLDNQFDPEHEIKIEDILKGAIADYIDSFYDSQKVKKHEEDIPFQDPSFLGKEKDLALENNFKEFLKRKKLSQTRVCELTNISKGNLSDILSNKHQPSLDNFLRLWAIVDCPSLDQILKRVPK